MLKVGIYWKGIKGRFNKGGMKRTYLAMKFGYKWLSKT